MTLTLPPALIGYPSAVNTGVLPGSTLTVIPGDFHTTKAYQELLSLDIKGKLFIDHDNVTVVNCKINGGLSNTRQNFRTWNCTFGNFTGIKATALTGSNITARRLNIFGFIDGVRAGGSNVDIQDCYSHDLFRTTDSAQPGGMTHNDHFQSAGGSNFILRRNRFECWTFESGQTAGKQDRSKSYYQTSAVGCYTGSSDISNVVIDDNLMYGRAYRYVYAVSKDGHVCKNFKITNNKFGLDNANYPSWVSSSTCLNCTVSGNVKYSGQ